MRFKDASVAVWEAFPETYLPVAEVVTELGGAEGTILVVAFAYWLGHRKKSATVASYVTAGVVFILLLKTGFALPRPVTDPALAVEPVLEYDDPHGFPSGHAFTSVVVYGGFVTVYGKLREPVWLLGTVSLVVAISLSRVVLRLHYLGDILVGAALGIGFLYLLTRLVGDRPTYGFGIGLAIAVPAVLLSGFGDLTLMGLGATIGGLLASPAIDDAPELRSWVEGVVLVVAGLVLVVLVVALQALVADVPTVGAVAIVIGQAVLIAGVILLPRGVHALDSKRQSLLSGDS